MDRIFWKDDEELFKLARKELFTAVIGDAMDKMGLFHQFLLSGNSAFKARYVYYWKSHDRSRSRYF
ncbi:hypothetical protein LZ575_09550 [Antarcticibacterium sp. 1MA-6-2]|uniref:hypothetical protein n=1 Tax=Antarcticibacterium sp. 1MA-6-2 TaxID=2908210 RepID=UPI001F18139B|nr:hypothetical protein [Antarcticibacterium sp. 1MA-6-2]UJH92680.1 hypothetical protein LZ575_09550 [Antarcticibacterium sp. 1MA-6-2]